MENYIIGLLILIIIIQTLRNWKLNFQCGYYSQKLKNRGVDISHVENIGIIGIFRS